MSTERTDNNVHFNTPGQAARQPAGRASSPAAPRGPCAPPGSPSRDEAPAAFSADRPGLPGASRARQTLRGPRSRGPPALCAVGRAAADTGPGHRWGVLGSVG